MPPVPTAGVPASVAVPLSVKARPLGRLPLSLKVVAAGKSWPVVTVNELAWPTVKVVLFALVMLGSASSARAHAALERAVPPVGSQVDQAPRQVVLTFTEGVEAAFSTIELRGPNGSPVTIGQPQMANGNKRQLSVELPALSGGQYTVVWHATSVDTHKTEGSFRFTVR